MAERSSHAVVLAEENGLLFMPKPGIVRALSSFSLPEVRKLTYQGQLIYSGPDFDVKVIPTQKIAQISLDRILIITPKKIGSAPQRNLLKRRLKSIFYEEKYYQQGYTLAFFCKKESVKRTFAELKALLQKIYGHLKKA